MLAALLGQVREADREQRRDRGNKLYQDGRKAYEAARLDVAEPLFRKAIEIIPEFPEPHLALAHVLARLGRAAEAEASLAESKRRLPDSYQPASPTEHEAAMASAEEAVSAWQDDLVGLAAEAARILGEGGTNLPPLVRLGDSLLRTAAHLEEGRALILAMQGSGHAQDAHNARIHGKEWVEHVGRFRRLLGDPTDGQKWWDAAIHGFNARRCYASGAVAMEEVFRLAGETDASRGALFLLFHAWQQTCDWRDYDKRLRAIERILEASLAQSAAAARRLVAAAAAAPADVEALAQIRAFRAPYVLLTSRLVDTRPALVRRAFAQNADEQLAGFCAAMRLRNASAPPAAGCDGGGAAGTAAGALAALRRTGRLTVGYFTGVPAGHVTYDLVGHLLRFHTDPRVEIVWFCGGTVNPLEFEKVKRGSQEAGGLKHAAVDGADDGGGGRHRLVNLHGLGPDEQAARVRDEGVGVIIDLDGWIGDDPPRLTLASRPAPVRAQWLGWAGSTGDPAMHYMVSDAALAPPSLYGGRYSERLVVLPGCYQLNDHGQLYGGALARRGAAELATSSPPEAGLYDGAAFNPTRAFSFANFNQLMKVAPDVFGVWAGALLRAPASRVALLTGVTAARLQYGAPTRNLRAELAAAGVAPARLLRGGALAKTEHLRRAADCDVAIDTLSYNSHTTGADVLWAGVPLVTQSGSYLASRVGRSLGENAGVPHARVASLKAYADLLGGLAAAAAPAPVTKAKSGRVGEERTRAAREMYKAAREKEKRKAPPPPDEPMETFGTFSLSGWASGERGRSGAKAADEDAGGGGLYGGGGALYGAG